MWPSEASTPPFLDFIRKQYDPTQSAAIEACPQSLPCPCPCPSLRCPVLALPCPSPALPHETWIETCSCHHQILAQHRALPKESSPLNLQLSLRLYNAILGSTSLYVRQEKAVCDVPHDSLQVAACHLGKSSQSSAHDSSSAIVPFVLIQGPPGTHPPPCLWPLPPLLPAPFPVPTASSCPLFTITVFCAC